MRINQILMFNIKSKSYLIAAFEHHELNELFICFKLLLLTLRSQSNGFRNSMVSQQSCFPDLMITF